MAIFNSHGVITHSQGITTRTSRFLFISSYPYTGPRIFSVYCFEAIEPHLWRLRSLNLFMYSQNMKVDLVENAGFVDVIHDGEVLFRIGSSADQERRSRAGTIVQ